jgi:hypothetical protein
VSAEPIRLSFRIDCSPEHAFDVWTTRLSTWWPKGHTTSGDPDAVVTLESRLGGRIFERASDGTDIEWGEITAWHPPHRPEVRVAHRSRARRLAIVHSGWERLGAAGTAWREANTAGWESMVPAFRAAAEG